MLRLIIWIRVAAVVAFLLTAAPLVLLTAALALACADLVSLFRRARPPANIAPSMEAVSVVIPNWNGRDLLEKYLPSVVDALARNPDNEILVVDNASTDGSADFLRKRFPQVRVLALDRNLGFGGGSNAGFAAARHDIVVLLNSDMRVSPDFLPPLLEGFRDPRVFAVSCQIFFTDPSKVRQETGLTEGLWINGRLRVRHVIDERVRTLFPVFYAGGGSSAYDRRKFLELGGFDPLYEPFYLEDTDLGYQAWKRGWTVHYEPRSVVYHEHRGTIGRTYNEAFIQAVLKKNFLLFAWKNIHDWRMLAEHLFQVYGGMWVRLLGGDTPARTSPRALLRAAAALPRVLRSRAQARRRAAIADREAFRRPLGGYFRDRFETPDPSRDKLRVLFLSPYPIYPPVHGGAVFMGQTLAVLGRLAQVHVICLLDWERELEDNRKLADLCASVEFLVRMPHDDHGWSAIVPHAARIFTSHDLAWRLHRTIFTEKIDVVQIEYTQLAVYAMDFRRIATFLFEHDIYFQSVGRLLRGERSPLRLAKSAFEYLRALRFELRAVRAFDAVQVCTRENRRYLESFVGRDVELVEGLRAGVDVSRYCYAADGREPESLLFVGNFRHLPNQEALLFLWQEVWPRIRQARPQARLYLVGAEAGPGFSDLYNRDGCCFLGQVEDIREPLRRYAVFLCPVLSGSGVRVKLLEAFAAGIPTVSTTVGAEGLTHGDFVELADDAATFARKAVELLSDPARARAMAARARREVEQHWDIEALTSRLERHYRDVLTRKLDHQQRTPYVH
jgi:GT2 family glycosyltransferase/glycosyltransferase involved in cell wall biosynthesis